MFAVIPILNGWEFPKMVGTWLLSIERETNRKPTFLREPYLGIGGSPPALIVVKRHASYCHTKKHTIIFELTD